MGNHRIIVISLFFTLMLGCQALRTDFPDETAEIRSIRTWAFYENDWNGVTKPDSVQIPHKWPNKGVNTFGYHMYRASLPDPGNYRDLSIRLPNVLSAFALLVNGDTLYQGGKPSKSRVGEEIRIYRDVIHIPTTYITDGDPLSLTLLASNHNYHVGGFLTPLVYGEHDSLHRLSVRQSLIGGLQSGALGLMSIFLFVYFIFRKKDLYILFFAILSLGLMLRILILDDYHILEFLPGIDGGLFLKFILITFYLGITLNYAVLTGLFPRIIPNWSRNAVLSIGGLAILFVLVTPLRIGSYSVPFFQLFSVVAGVILIAFTFKAAMQHRQGAKTVLVGGFVALTFLVNDILFNNQLISTGNWSGWGVLIYLFLLIVVISRRFSSAMENEEGLNERLQQLNRSLEFRVEERTHKLESLKNQIEEEARSVKEANNELIKFKEDEQSLLRIMVHDLKAPFNKIKGLAQIMRMNDRYRGGEEEELNEMILKIAEEGRLLIDDLNVLTMYEAHLNDVESYQKTCISELLQDSVRSHGAYAQSKDITIDYHFNHHVESWINPNMLSRIIDNLLSNAIKFSKEGKAVRVELIKRADSYEVSISDEGPGFTEEDREKIYGKFQKLSARPTRGESSTGLGLSIVKNLTDLMGGEIQLESQPGEGASFRLIFPIRHNSERIS